MKNLAALLAFLAGCTAGPTWESLVEEPEMPPPPPEKLLRKPADFRIRDVNLQKEFFLYFYEDEAIKEDIVAVINHALPEGQRTLRMATPDEHDYAMALFIDHWRAQGDDVKFRYFKELHEQDRRRSATLLDQQIRFKAAELKQLQEEKYELEADLKSRKDTGTFASGDEKFKLISNDALATEIRNRERRALHAELQLWLLEYKRALRDVEYARQMALMFVDARMPVADLLPFYSAPERLVDDVRTNVQPHAWKRSQSYIALEEGELVIRQTRDMTFQVRDYLDKLRRDIAARQKEAFPGQKVAPLDAPAPK